MKSSHSVVIPSISGTTTTKIKVRQMNGKLMFKKFFCFVLFKTLPQT